MRKLISGLFLPWLLQSQIPIVAQKTTVLSQASEAITIQQPTSQGRLVKFKSANVDCSSACTITFERNGSPANSTPLQPVNINPTESISTTKAFSSSNAGTGTVIQVLSLPNGGLLVIDLTLLNFQPSSGPGQNFTIRTDTITATVHITIIWTEQ